MRSTHLSAGLVFSSSKNAVIDAFSDNEMNDASLVSARHQRKRHYKKGCCCRIVVINGRCGSRFLYNDVNLHNWWKSQFDTRLVSKDK
jgi:hypothetical protein